MASADRCAAAGARALHDAVLQLLEVDVLLLKRAANYQQMSWHPFHSLCLGHLSRILVPTFA